MKRLFSQPNLKILAIADLHNTISDKNIEIISQTQYDVLFLLGDIGDKAMKHLINVIDTNKTFGVLGNHDDFNLYANYNIPELKMQSVLIINGIIIKGESGSRRYKEGDFPMMTEEESFKKFSPCYGSCNILVTHDYPYDLYSWINNKDIAHSGLKGINNYLEYSNSPKLLLHGHLHRNTETVFHKTKIIGVHGCSLINYKNGKSKNLFEP